MSVGGCNDNNDNSVSSYSNSIESSAESSQEDSSVLTKDNFYNEYYNQLFVSTNYSMEEARTILKNAINKDLWYYGEYSKFYKLIGKEYPYFCNRATSKSIGYLIHTEFTSDAINIDNYTENFSYVSLEPSYYQTEVTIYECEELKVNNKNDFLDIINKNHGVIFMDRDYIKIDKPSKPKYISSEYKNKELDDIKSNLTEVLQKANIKGKNTIYVKDFLDEFYQTDEFLMVTTDVFIVDENNNIYLAVYDKNLYQSTENVSNANWFNDEIIKINLNDKKAMYYFTKVKETAVQTYILEINM